MFLNQIALVCCLFATPLLAPPPNDPIPEQAPPDSSPINLPRPLSTSGSRRTFECFNRNSPQLLNNESPIIHNIDCARALQQIQPDKSLAPMVFTRVDGAGFRVPYSWRHGSCIIFIDTARNPAGTLVQLSLTVIAQTAMHVMKNCVDLPPIATGLGGQAFLKSFDGNGGILDVVVIGRTPPKIDVPRFRYNTDYSRIMGTT
ncbi:hypothetical protein MMC16_007774 [Acarospora aff. strigata]|nr:hypothetical protein [Acarospora aff. strigata]